MATTDIVIKDETGAMVSWEDFAGEWEDDGTSDVQPSFPIVKVVQGTSTMQGAGKHGGDFWHSDTEEYDSFLTCVALVRRSTRAMFAADESQPVCMSADGNAPLPNMPQWIDAATPASCAECLFGVWGDDGTPPACKGSDVLLVDRGGGDLAQLRVGGKSLKPLRQFIARKCKPKNLPLYAYRLTLSTEEKSDVGKKWHELVIQSELMRPAEAKTYSDTVRAQRERFEGTLRDSRTVEWTEETTPDNGGWESV